LGVFQRIAAPMHKTKRAPARYRMTPTAKERKTKRPG
jgi:hypothetical protein